MNTQGMGLGYLNFMDTQRKADSTELQAAMMRQKLEQAQRAQEAEGAAGKTLMDYFAADEGQLPPSPGEPSKPAAPAQGAPAAGGPPSAPKPQQMAPSPNYKSFDDHVAAAQPQAGGGDAMPAAPEPAAGAEKSSVQAKKPKGLNVGELVKTLKRNNVPDWQVFKTIEALQPMMTAANKAEMDQLRLQVQIDRNNMSETVAQMRVDQKDRELAFKEEKQRQDLEYKKSALHDRIGIMRDRVSAENRRTDLQIKQLERQVKNDDQKEGYRRVQALNAQMKSIEQEFPGLENMAVNGNQQQREAAGARLEVLRTEYDKLYEKYNGEVGSFLDLTDKHVQESKGGKRPAAAGSGKGKTAAQAKGGRKVGDVVTQGGKKYKITGFTDDGVPQGEPVE